jgi:hypothetical protein
MVFELIATNWRIFRRQVGFSLEKISKDHCWNDDMRLHNFVLENNGLKLDNREESYLGIQFGLLPLPGKEGLDAKKNESLPTITPLKCREYH